MEISGQSSKQDTPQQVKADPTRKSSKKYMLFMTILGLFWFGFALFYLLINVRHSTGPLFIFWLYLLIGALYLMIPLRFRKNIAKWRQYEQRRQLAAQGNHDQVSLASEQPVPDALALPLSTILRARNRSSANIIVFGILFLLIVLIAISIEITLLFLSIIHINTVSIIISIAILLILLALTVLGAVYSSRQPVQQLEVTENGLLKRVGKKVTVVPWDEARLFAITPTSPTMKKKSDPPANYELSSADAVLRWFTNERLGQTTAPSEECYQQMQALLSVIAARTGLPLYDLR